MVEQGGPGTAASLLAHSSHSDGSGGHHVYRTGLAAALGDIQLNPSGKAVQNGREVYRWAVTEVPKGMRELSERAGIPLAEVDHFAPHSANLRMLESICERTGYPMERTLHSLVRYGNTSAASIPLSLDLAVLDGRMKEGDTMLLYGFGSGLTHAGALLRWTVPGR